MAYILCEEHGGNIASLVSPEVARHVALDGRLPSDTIEIRFTDVQGNIYKNIVDEGFLKDKEDELELDLRAIIADEEILFLVSLDLVPICPLCLKIARGM